MNIYEQFINFCESIVGKVDTKILIYSAAVSLAFFLVWIVLNIVFNKLRRFYIKCQNLTKYVNASNLNKNNYGLMDKKAQKFSRNFSYSWKKFKESDDKKPSEVIFKRDVLDSEVNARILNNGKTLMRTFINITTILLFVFNLAILGENKPVTFNIFVDASFLPIAYYFVMILFYFISNLLRNQLYTIASANFYELLDCLDNHFYGDGANLATLEDDKTIQINSGDLDQQNLNSEDLKNNKVDEKLDQTQNQQTENELKTDDENLNKDSDENVQEIENELDNKTEQINEESETSLEENKTQVEESEEVENHEETNNLEETNSDDQPQNEESDNENEVESENNSKVEEANSDQSFAEKEFNLDEFNLDDFKIEDSDDNLNEETSNNFEPANDEITSETQVQNEDNQNSNEALKEDNNNLEDNEENNKDEIEEVVSDSKNYNDDGDNDVESFDVFKKKNIDVDKYINELPNSNNYSTPYINVDRDYIPGDDGAQNGSKETESDVALNEEEIKNNSTNVESDENEKLDQELGDEHSDSENQNNDQDQFEAEEIENEKEDENVSAQSFDEEVSNVKSDESENLGQVDDDEENFDINELLTLSDEENSESKNEPENSKQNEVDEPVKDETPKNQLKEQLTKNIGESNDAIGSKLDDNKSDLKEIENLVNEFKQNKKVDESVDDQQNSVEDTEADLSNNKKTESDAINKLYDKIDSLENKVNDALDKKSESSKPKKKTKSVKESSAGRGRPKSRVIDSDLVINNDAEFEEILSAAEKLMRKSESNKNPSKAKEIDDELKIMIEAMNKYKEGQK